MPRCLLYVRLELLVSYPRVVAAVRRYQAVAYNSVQQVLLWLCTLWVFCKNFNVQFLYSGTGYLCPIGSSSLYVTKRNSYCMAHLNFFVIRVFFTFRDGINTQPAVMCPAGCAVLNTHLCWIWLKVSNPCFLHIRSLWFLQLILSDWLGYCYFLFQWYSIKLIRVIMCQY